MKLLNGEQIENNQWFSEKELKNMEKKKKLKIIGQEDKGEWDVNDSLSVKLMVKNMKTVEVKVFQLNSEEYYLKHMK